MSLFGSLTAAISGLTAQSRALGHISDNVANSQTVGYKRIDSNFVSYISQSSANLHVPGAVIARPDFTNSVQGTIEQAEEPLSLAIGGQGFFSVALARGTVNGQPVFDERQFFTRAGDVRLDQDGYLVNGAGYYLQGWPSDALGNPDRTILAPIRVNQQVFNPVATRQIDLAANLPADATTAPITTQAEVYDSLGRLHTVNLTFTNTGTNAWTLALNVPDDIGDSARGSIGLRFGAAAVPAVTDGTIGSFVDATGAVLPPATSAGGDPAAFRFTADFGQGPQTVTLSLGQFGRAQGLTQYSGTEFAVRNRAQDGVPLGAYSGLSIRNNGDVAVNYDNGQSRVIARVPLVAFNDPEKLQRLDGQAFMRTPESGEARVTDAASNGVGKLVTGSVERSNVDIATEFTKLIVAQRAYTANTRVVTTSDEMLQDTINMRR
ncbi:flagellar hook protein FlgE [Roseicella aerolata]|uniref:Flagellar hook protein FlgE n=1 Tax=Roseicella aerolata TaxID=2883479 RepID=A0A9X1L8A0_9PROT|nr:flagellar hook protein FlgE [Roseicella aerolata]MCB4822339.1 flagellar hook protein FlgE [Roseicella aerolata]